MRDDPIKALPDQPTIPGGHHQPYTAYNQGWDASEAGYPRSLNPYAVDSDDEWERRTQDRNRRWWLDGYNDQGDYEDDLDGDPPGPTMEEAGALAEERQWKTCGFC